jgi:hypothetical protein
VLQQGLERVFPAANCTTATEVGDRLAGWRNTAGGFEGALMPGKITEYHD